MIWLVEDDAGIRELEVYTLKSTGFEAEGFSDGASFRVALEKAIPELVILDVMLPGEDGVSLLRFLRGQPKTSAVPVIMATAKGQEYDKVSCLDLGADDYLVKPFGMLEMVSRVRAVLRRSKPLEAPRLLRNNGLVLHLDERTASVDGSEIQLTFKEYELLRLFLSHPGMAFTRDQLFSEIWGSDFSGETRTVDMHVKTLRQKLGAYGALIETVCSVGYRMRAST